MKRVLVRHLHQGCGESLHSSLLVVRLWEREPRKPARLGRKRSARRMERND